MREMLLLLFLVGALAGCAGNATTGNPAQTDNTTTGNSTQTSPAVVYIDGHEVHSQGKYPWHSGMTVKDLIKAAGGLTEFAAHSSIHITHADGTRDTLRYPSILCGKTKDPVLRPGDIVHVSTPII
jgi:protein involved in polysaccharide export with SLBB domain